MRMIASSLNGAGALDTQASYRNLENGQPTAQHSSRAFCEKVRHRFAPSLLTRCEFGP